MIMSKSYRVAVKHVIAVLLFVLILAATGFLSQNAYASTTVDFGRVGNAGRTVSLDFEVMKETPIFKVVPDKTGTLCVDVWDDDIWWDPDVNYNMRLYKKIDGKLTPVSYKQNTEHFCVKKGSTYYIKFYYIPPEYGKCSADTVYVGINCFGLSDGGSSKVSASKISKGCWRDGYVRYEDGKKDWYKFRVTKKGYYTIGFYGDTKKSFHGKYKISLYKKGHRKAIKTVTFSNGYRCKKFSKKLKKGTYYIRVYNPYKLNNGIYSIGWDKKGKLS